VPELQAQHESWRASACTNWTTDWMSLVALTGSNV